MMHGPISDRNDQTNAAPSNSVVAAFEHALAFCNRMILVLAALALVGACLVLTDSVVGRALFQSPNYWQDEMAVFLLVGATFMTAAYVQSQRGQDKDHPVAKRQCTLERRHQ